MMRRRYGYLFLFIITFAFSLEAKTFLYKVNDAHGTVYILGSIHIAKKRLYPLKSIIMKAYKQSNTLVVEVDPTTKKSILAIQNAVVRLGLYPANKSLKTELSAKTYNRLKEYTRKVGISLKAMQKMRPWSIMLQLTLMQAHRLGYSAELGIDNYFLNMAQKDKKVILELETAKEQMRLLSKDDKNFQDKLLFYTLESMQEMEPMLDEMFKSWQSGNEKSFNEIISTSLDEDSDFTELYANIITKRNYKMTKKIENLLAGNRTCFVVVGSGHLVGKKGIIALLRERGYQVIQM